MAFAYGLWIDDLRLTWERHSVWMQTNHRNFVRFTVQIIHDKFIKFYFLKTKNLKTYFRPHLPRSAGVDGTQVEN